MIHTLDEEYADSRLVIGVFGSTDPRLPYAHDWGVELGSRLRRFVEGSNDSIIMTGGVDGVGADVYCGAVMETAALKSDQSHFVAMIPTHFLIQDKDTNETFTEPFELPQSYYCLSMFSPQGINVMHVLGDMQDRRIAFAKTTDIAIVVSGGHGTLDEAIHLLRQGKPLITASESGGAASELAFDPKYAKIRFYRASSIDEIMTALNDALQYLPKKKLKCLVKSTS